MGREVGLRFQQILRHRLEDVDGLLDIIHGTVYSPRMPKKRVVKWDAKSVKGLRRHLAVTQVALATEIGVRQQTVSDWETGVYAPRGASVRELNIVAERAELDYGTGSDADADARNS